MLHFIQSKDSFNSIFVLTILQNVRFWIVSGQIDHLFNQLLIDEGGMRIDCAFIGLFHERKMKPE